MLAWAGTILFAAVGRRSATPQDLTALPDELRSVVADCLTPDPAGRPLARAILTELLSGHDLSAGLLAEGSRQARAAAHTAVRTVVPPGRQTPRRTRSKLVLWIAASTACVLAIAAAAIYITGRHSGPGATGRTGTPHPSPQGDLAAPSQTIPAQFAGSWSGTVHQANPALSVTVQVSLAPGTAHGTITYPQLGCSGNLGLMSAGHGLLTLGQTITSGQDNCVDGQIKLAAQPGGTLHFTFLSRSGGNPAGTLARQT
jgi:hypothetical protein